MKSWSKFFMLLAWRIVTMYLRNSWMYPEVTRIPQGDDTSKDVNLSSGLMMEGFSGMERAGQPVNSTNRLEASATLYCYNVFIP